MTLGGGTPSFVTKHPTAESVLQGVDFDIKNLPLRDPKLYKSGQRHHNMDHWNEVLNKGVVDEDIQFRISRWLTQGVDVKEFFSHFKGNFKGLSYDSDEPSSIFLENSISCRDHKEFVDQILYEKIRIGAIRVLGKIGECDMPRVVMPLLVEPSKPRLCLDGMYLNLWIKDSPFRLETLNDVHMLIDSEAWMATCDEKSGYEHIALSENSDIMVYTVLPFGWKASPYVYQTVGMTITSYLRKLNVISTQYIDDRLMIANPSEDTTDLEAKEHCFRVIYALLQILTRLGYTISLEKSFLEPQQCVRFLGFLVDSVKLAYILPEDKKFKFRELRESLLAGREVSIRTLQHFAGKCVSMGLAIPGAKLYCREVNNAISCGVKNSKRIVIGDELREELKYWRFLDSWKGYAKWRSESHKQVNISTDASGYKYGAVVCFQGEKVELGDFWETNDSRPIHLKEAEAVLQVLKSIEEVTRDSRVD